MALLASTTALCFGLSAIYLGTSGDATDAAVGLAGVASWVLKGKQDFGPDSPKVMRAIGKRVQEAFEKTYGRENGWSSADLEIADEAMHAALGRGATLNKDDIARAAIAPEGLPTAVINKIMSKLGEADPENFGPKAKAKGKVSYTYANAVLSAGLEAAFENEEFFKKLQPKLLLEMASALGKISNDTAAIIRKQELSDEKIDAVLAQLEKMRPEIDTGISVLRAVAKRFQVFNPDHTKEDLLLALENAADHYLKLKLLISSISLGEEDVSKLTTLAQEAINKGLFEEADAYLAEAEDLQLKNNTLRSITEQAKTRDVRIEAALLADDVKRAAINMCKVLDWFLPFDKSEAISRANRYGMRLVEYCRKSLNGNFEEAILVLSQGLSFCDKTSSPKEWVETQNNLATACLEYGKKNAGEKGKIQINKAIDLFDEILKSRERGNTTFSVAGVQGNLGIAYLIRSDRVKGADGKADLFASIKLLQEALKNRNSNEPASSLALTKNNLGVASLGYFRRLGGGEGKHYLKQAIVHFSDLLSIFTKEDSPIEWANTQVNLGNAYFASCECLGGEASAIEMQRGIDAYNAALLVYDEAGSLNLWAKTKSNLGVAHLRRSERLGGKERAAEIKQSIANLEDILKIYSKDNSPIFWASVNYNLGNAHLASSDYLSGFEILTSVEKSILAFSAALSVLKKDSTPDMWADTSNDLGRAYLKRSEHIGEEARENDLNMAIDSLKESLEVYNKDHSPMSWARAKQNLGSAYFRHYSYSGSTAMAKLSAEAFESVADVYTKDNAPIDWAMTQNNLGSVYLFLGERSGGNDRVAFLERAVDYYNLALEVHSETSTPADWAMTQINIGVAYFLVANTRGGEARVKTLTKSLHFLRASLRVYSENDSPMAWANNQNSLGEVLYSLGCVKSGSERVSLLTEAIQSFEAAGRVYSKSNLIELRDRSASNLNLARRVLAQITPPRA